jgi:hypothetical protein
MIAPAKEVGFGAALLIGIGQLNEGDETARASGNGGKVTSDRSQASSGTGLRRHASGDRKISFANYFSAKRRLAADTPQAEGEEMTKTPGEFEPPKPVTKAQREARMAFRQVDAGKAMTEHETAQKAFAANQERLKSERLAREAAGPPVTAKKAKTKKAK